VGGVDGGDEIKQLRIGPITIGYRRRPTPNAFTDLGQALDDLGAEIKKSAVGRLANYFVGVLGRCLRWMDQREAERAER